MASAPDLAEATQVFLFSLPTEAGGLLIGWVAEGSYVGSLVALQLALAPVMLLGIERHHDVTIQRLLNAIRANIVGPVLAANMRASGCS